MKLSPMTSRPELSQNFLDAGLPAARDLICADTQCRPHCRDAGNYQQTCAGTCRSARVPTRGTSQAGSACPTDPRF